MKKFRDMSDREKKVLTACRNGWWLSGVYEAVFDEHRRKFTADSIPELYKSVLGWHGQHIENHADANILVRCTLPC